MDQTENMDDDTDAHVQRNGIDHKGVVDMPNMTPLQPITKEKLMNETGFKHEEKGEEKEHPHDKVKRKKRKKKSKYKDSDSEANSPNTITDEHNNMKQMNSDKPENINYVESMVTNKNGQTIQGHKQSDKDIECVEPNHTNENGQRVKRRKQGGENIEGTQQNSTNENGETAERQEQSGEDVTDPQQDSTDEYGQVSSDDETTTEGIGQSKELEEGMSKSLHQLAEEGDVERISLILGGIKNTKREVNKKDEKGLTPLHIAASYNQLNVAKSLIRFGADIYCTDDEGQTPLHYAARYILSPGKENEDDVEFQDKAGDMITYLVKCGARLNCIDHYGHTPLHFAAIKGNEYTCRLLLQQDGIDVQSRDELQKTPLHMAAAYKKPQTVKMLIEAGADVTLKDEMNFTPLHLCCSDVEGLETATVLLDTVSKKQGADVVKQLMKTKDHEGNACLNLAVNSGRYEIAKLCIKYGADVNKKNLSTMCPLHVAAINGDTKMVKMLLKKGAEIDILNKEKITPLCTAVQFNRIEVIKLLLKKGADIEKPVKIGEYTPLLMGCMYGRADIVKLLLEQNADYSATSTAEKTGIYLATEKNHLECLKVCLCDENMQKMVNDADEKKNSPLHVAAEKGFVDCMMNMVLTQTVKMKKKELPYTLLLSWEEQNLLISKGSLVRAKDEDAFTPLHFAAYEGHTETVSLLIDLGADREAINGFCWTPLDCAAARGRTEAAKVLLEAETSIDLTTDRSQTTPLHLAAQFGHVDMIELLIEWKANVRLKDKEGRNCLDIAIESHKRGYQFLLFCFVATLKKRKATLKALENDIIWALSEVSKSNFHTEEESDTLKESERDLATPLVNSDTDDKVFSDTDISKDQNQGSNFHTEEESDTLKESERDLATPLVNSDTDDKVFSDTDISKDQNQGSNLHTEEESDTLKEGEQYLATPLINSDTDDKVFSDTDISKDQNQGSSLHTYEESDTLTESEQYLSTPVVISETEDQAISDTDLPEDSNNRFSSDYDNDDSLDEDYNPSGSESDEDKAAIAILNTDQWKVVLRNTTHNEYTGERETPMRKLIKEMPDVAKLVLDKCTHVEERMEAYFNPLDRKVVFNFEFLDDAYFIDWWRHCGENDKPPETEDLFDEDWSLLDREVEPYTNVSEKFKENHPLMIMVSSKREALLQHPLVAALLRRKWQAWTNRIFYINYMMYIIYLIFITGYIVSTTPPYVEDASVSALTSNPSYCGKLHTSGYSQPTFAKVGKYIVTILSCWNLLREILQMFQGRLSYISWENLIELVTYICSILFVNDFEECQKSTGYRYVWQWNAGTIAVLLAWVNLVLFSQKFLFGLYVVMLKDIISTFFRFFLLFMLLIVGFALAFFATLQNQSSFGTVWQSLVKTTVMMIGEFEFDSIYIEGKVNSEVVGYLLFYVFMIFMTIIVMNLMVGLAVDNIKEVQDQAELKRKGMQIELALDIETLWPDIVRRKFVCLKETVRPQLHTKTFFQRIFGPKSFGFTAESLKDAIYPEKSEVDDQKETIAEMKKDIREMKELLKGLLNDRRSLAEQTN